MDWFHFLIDECALRTSPAFLPTLYNYPYSWRFCNGILGETFLCPSILFLPSPPYSLPSQPHWGICKPVFFYPRNKNKKDMFSGPQLHSTEADCECYLNSLCKDAHCHCQSERKGNMWVVDNLLITSFHTWRYLRKKVIILWATRLWKIHQLRPTRKTDIFSNPAVSLWSVQR